MKDKILEIVNCSTKELKELSADNNKFIEYIKNPLSFYSSKPGCYNDASNANDGETKWQRELYKNECIWYDLELPIGQEKSKRTSSNRIDLIGCKDGKYILCELKCTKNTGQPFDAILQLLSYYLMIKQNAEKLDSEGVHHCNARNKDFKWVDVSKDLCLLLKANTAYGDNWSKTTPKNCAAKMIINKCREIGVNIKVDFSDERLFEQ